MKIILIMAGLILAFFVGYKSRDLKKTKVIDEEEKRKYERQKESFQEMMNYDYETALGSDRR